MPNYDSLRARFPQLKPMLNPRQAAEFIGVCTATLCHWRQRGSGPPWIRIGPHNKGLIRYPVAEFMLWLQERESSPSTDVERRAPNRPLKSTSRREEWDVDERNVRESAE